MIEAILKGERNKEKLLKLCHTKIIKNKKDEVLKALNGRYTKQGLFALRQAFESYCFYQNQIEQCDQMIDEVLQKISRGKPDQKTDVRRKPIRHNKPDIDNLGSMLLKIFDGRDATTLSGITDYSWMQLLSETGGDLSRWPTEKHYTSWLGLAPGQNNSGRIEEKQKKIRTPQSSPNLQTDSSKSVNKQTYSTWSIWTKTQRQKRVTSCYKINCSQTCSTLLESNGKRDGFRRGRNKKV